MDRFEAMSVLVAAADGGSLSAAARSLGMPLATVSRKISELEAHLRTQLLVRTSRRLELTEAGEIYIAACRRILDYLDEAERTASGEYRAPRGTLTVTAPIVFGRLHVEPIVLAFLQAYPDIAVRLILTDELIDITEEHVDVAVRIGTLPDSSMKAVRAGMLGRVVCASPAYLAQRGIPEAPEELVRHDCVTFGGSHSSAGVWRFGVGTTVLAVPVRSRLAVNTAEAAVDAAVAGLGITRVLSYQAASAVKAGTLRLVLRMFEPEPTPVSLVYPGQRLLPLKARSFLDFATPRLRSAVAEISALMARPADAAAPVRL